MTIITAYDQNRLIGADGILPWHERDDLIHFQKITHNSIVIMGRKTWDSLPCKPLKYRSNIILSKTKPFGYQWTETMSKIPNAFILSEFDDIYEYYRDDVKKFVIGGESIYRLALESGLVTKVIASEMKFKTDISGKNSLCYFPAFEYKGRRVTAQYENFDVVEYEL